MSNVIEKKGLELFLPLYIEEQGKLAVLQAELKQVNERKAEVRGKITIAEQALNCAVSDSQSAITGYAKGHTDETAVTLSRATVRNLENQIADLKLILETIDSEILKTDGLIREKTKVVGNRKGSVWNQVVDAELEKARPYIERAFAAMTNTGFNPDMKKNFSDQVLGLSYMRGDKSADLTASLISEYGL